MRFTGIPVALATLILFVAVPVGGAPSLQVGSYAKYDLSLSFSFAPPLCEPSSALGTQMSILYCPVIDTIPPSVAVNGTINWTVTALNQTTATLNVTHSFGVSGGDSLAMPVFQHSSSFNESINLATRIASIMPFLRSEMDQALQLAQSNMATSLPTATDWSTSMNLIDSTIIASHPIYTMWWVNGPLKLNETIPVLVFRTNVTRSTSLSIPGIGTRSAWTLNATLPEISSMQDPSTVYPVPSGAKFLAAFSFNYDQKSDLLLSASTLIHLGFLDTVYVGSSQCQPTATVKCPTSGTGICIESGINIKATLTLTKTNLNLDQPLASTTPPDTGNTGGSTVTGSGPTGTSNASGIGSGPSSGSVSSSNGGSGTGTGSNPSTNPSPASTKPPSASPWLYWILGIVVVAIVVAAVVFARRWKNSSQVQSPTAQSVN